MLKPMEKPDLGDRQQVQIVTQSCPTAEAGQTGRVEKELRPLFYSIIDYLWPDCG